MGDGGDGSGDGRWRWAGAMMTARGGGPVDGGGDDRRARCQVTMGAWYCCYVGVVGVDLGDCCCCCCCSGRVV